MNCGGGLIQAITRKHTVSPVLSMTGRTGRTKRPQQVYGLSSRNKGEVAWFSASGVSGKQVCIHEKRGNCLKQLPGGALTCGRPRAGVLGCTEAGFRSVVVNLK